MSGTVELIKKTAPKTAVWEGLATSRNDDSGRIQADVSAWLKKLEY